MLAKWWGTNFANGELSHLGDWLTDHWLCLPKAYTPRSEFGSFELQNESGGQTIDKPG